VKDLPRYDFPAISDAGDEERRVGPRLEEASFGESVIQEEVLYEDVGGEWRKGEWGERIGMVRLIQSPTTVGGKVLLRAWFLFDDGTTAEYAGLVPGEGTWQGEGELGFRGGTGKFEGRRGHLHVESVNPKRWG